MSYRWLNPIGGAVDPPKQATVSGTGGQVYLLRINHVINPIIAYYLTQSFSPSFLPCCVSLSIGKDPKVG